MTALGLDISHTAYKLVTKIDSLFVAFSNSKFVKALEKAEARRAEYYAMRSTYNTLNKMTDYELRDIGLCRGNIYEVSFNKAR